MKGDFWFGPDDVDRRKKYAKEFTPEIQANGDDTDRRIRGVHLYYGSRHGVRPGILRYSSGWRPTTINEITSHAGKLSTHLAGNAGDVEGEEFAWWCFRNLWLLEQKGLWMEHPVATVIRAKKDGKAPWCHLQRVPPKSGLRCYFPDDDAAALWDAQTRASALATSEPLKETKSA